MLFYNFFLFVSNSGYGKSRRGVKVDNPITITILLNSSYVSLFEYMGVRIIPISHMFFPLKRNPIFVLISRLFMLRQIRGKEGGGKRYRFRATHDSPILFLLNMMIKNEDFFLFPAYECMKYMPSTNLLRHEENEKKSPKNIMKERTGPDFPHTYKAAHISFSFSHSLFFSWHVREIIACAALFFRRRCLAWVRKTGIQQRMEKAKP